MAYRYEGVGDSIIVFPIDTDDVEPVTVFSRMTLTHDSESNFIVNGLLTSNLVNEIGSYSGTIRVPTDGLFGLEIIADGPWTVSFSE